MSKCKGTNCTACEENEYYHSPECMLEYEHTIDMNRVSVSLSQMKYWVDQLNEHGYLFIDRLTQDMCRYIDVKERDGIKPE